MRAFSGFNEISRDDVFLCNARGGEIAVFLARGVPFLDFLTVVDPSDFSDCECGGSSHLTDSTEWSFSINSDSSSLISGRFLS